MYTIVGELTFFFCFGKREGGECVVACGNVGAECKGIFVSDAQWNQISGRSVDEDCPLQAREIISLRSLLSYSYSYLLLFALLPVTLRPSLGMTWPVLSFDPEGVKEIFGEAFGARVDLARRPCGDGRKRETE